MTQDPAIPFVLGDNNVWPLRLDASEGGGWLLIDAGADYRGGEPASWWDVLTDQARAADVQPEHVRAVLVTHEHFDHAGLAVRWAELGARVLAGHAALPALALGFEAYERQRLPRLADLERHGAPDDLLAVWANRRPTSAWQWEPCPEDALDPAEDGASFRLDGGRTLRVVAAPGHTPGNLVALVEETGELFSGDTVIPTTIPTPGLHYPAAVTGDPEAPRWPSLPPFLRSIGAIRALGVTRVYPGHGEVIEKPALYLDRFEGHHARRATKVREALAGAGEATAFELARSIFPRLTEHRLFQAMTEVLGHLDLLAERSEVECNGRPVRWRFKRAAGGEP
ncbi:MAG: MBL fold metallo-hydrolase [Dehalococcoidia bacterium]